MIVNVSETDEKKKPFLCKVSILLLNIAEIILILHLMLASVNCVVIDIYPMPMLSK